MKEIAKDKRVIQRVGMGQDSHRIVERKKEEKKRCILGGVILDESIYFDADSDGDVILHAICNGITSLTHVPILGGKAISLCHEKGIKDSKVYLAEALKTFKNEKIIHVAISIEGKRPRLQDKIDAIRESIANLMGLEMDQVGITVTSGDGLSSFGRGEGVQCFSIVTTEKRI